MLCQQRRKSQPHGIVPAGQCMQEHRHPLCFAQRLHLRRAGHWNARCVTPGDILNPGDHCRVTEIHSTLLLVEPILTESRKA